MIDTIATAATATASTTGTTRTPKTYKKRYTSFAAEGGGVCGIAYTGAVRAMEEADVLKGFKNFAGTSAGAIVAATLACKASADYMDSKLGTVDFNDFLDNSWGILRDIYRLFTKHGWNRGDAFLKWMGEIMHDLTGDSTITIEQVHTRFGSTLILVAWNNSTRSPVYFNRKTYPDMPVRDAVRMSMSVPLLFRSCWMDINGKRCEIVDGGVGHNYPLSVFDFEEYCSPEAVLKRRLEDLTERSHEAGADICDAFVNHEAIGFRVDNNDDFEFEEKKWIDTSGLKASMQSLVSSIYILSQKASEKATEVPRTVRIDCGKVFPFDFALDADTRKSLVAAGYRATKDYLQRFASNAPRL